MVVAAGEGVSFDKGYAVVWWEGLGKDGSDFITGEGGFKKPLQICGY